MEAKLIAAVVSVVLIALGGFLAGDRFGTHRVQAAWDADKVAAGKALAEQQAKVIDVLQQRDQLEAIVERNHETMDAQNQQLIDADADRVRDIAAAVHRCTVPGAMDHPAGSVTAAAVSGSDAEIADGFERVAKDIAAVETAGYADSAELTGILQLAPKVTP